MRVSHDLWPWRWPWAHPGCTLTWSPSCESLVAIRPFACEKKRFVQKFTDRRMDRRRTPRHCISSFLEWAKTGMRVYFRVTYKIYTTATKIGWCDRLTSLLTWCRLTKYWSVTSCVEYCIFSTIHGCISINIILSCLIVFPFPDVVFHSWEFGNGRFHSRDSRAPGIEAYCEWLTKEQDN